MVDNMAEARCALANGNHGLAARPDAIAESRPGISLSDGRRPAMGSAISPKLPSVATGYAITLLNWRATLRYRTGYSKTCRFCAGYGDERTQQCAFRPHDANLFRVHLDALGERAEGGHCWGSAS